MFFAVPFFKNASYLKETLYSLLDQTDKNWRAIVFDDSIDPVETADAEACLNQIGDPRIHYERNPKNIGMAGNWNQAFDQAKDHALMCILHADDRLKPDYVETMKSFASRNPKASAYFCKTEIIGEDSAPVFSFADAYKNTLLPKGPEIKIEGISGIKTLIPGNFIFCPSVSYRAQDFASERFDPKFKMVLDFEFILRSLLAGKTWMGFYERPLFQYRRHSNNSTVKLTKDLRRFHEEISLYLDLSLKLKARGETEVSIQVGRMKIVKLNLGFEVFTSLIRFQFAQMFAAAKLLLKIL